ncbi:hypothetical protein PInf_016968 [Phytophthora infestans]|nr:hypothetical protein PInf_016968 [Phytophthora infestans]
MSGRVSYFARSSSQYVDLSRRGFAVWWTVLLLVHLLTGGYNAAFALFYHELKHTYLYACLDYSGIGMPAENHEVISLVNAVMAAIHGGFALLVIGGQYDSKLTGFPVEMWYDDEWSAHVLNEFQMILVVSWMDLASRTIFSIGVISTAANLKDFLHFHITTGIKVYNTSVDEWGESAAVTNTNHPALIWFYFVRVKVKDGRLPAGILSSDFPGNLYGLEFTYTNIRELPDDLDSKWLLGTTVYFEYSELTNVPDSLIRIEPVSISLVGSPITELPPQLFEIADLSYLYMACIPINELPRDVDMD